MNLFCCCVLLNLLRTTAKILYLFDFVMQSYIIKNLAVCSSLISLLITDSNDSANFSKEFNS